MRKWLIVVNRNSRFIRNPGSPVTGWWVKGNPRPGGHYGKLQRLQRMQRLREAGRKYDRGRCAVPVLVTQTSNERSNSLNLPLERHRGTPIGQLITSGSLDGRNWCTAACSEPERSHR